MSAVSAMKWTPQKTTNSTSPEAATWAASWESLRESPVKSAWATTSSDFVGLVMMTEDDQSLAEFLAAARDGVGELGGGELAVLLGDGGLPEHGEGRVGEGTGGGGREHP